MRLIRFNFNKVIAIQSLSTVNGGTQTTLNYNKATVQGIDVLEKLVQVLEKRLLLNSLLLSGNNIGDEGVKIIAPFLSNNKQLISLGLNDNAIGNEGIKALSKALLSNNTLEDLYLKANNIEDTQLIDLSHLLLNNQTLVILLLSSNRITLKDSSDKALANALQKNYSLKKLDLGKNDINNSGLAFLKSLEKNQTLTSLDIRENNIGCNGISTLSNALKKNESLRWLDLGNNMIQPCGIKQLTSALQINASIEYTDFRIRNHSKFNGSIIESELMINKQLQLDDKNRIRNKDIQNLINTHIQSLNWILYHTKLKKLPNDCLPVIRSFLYYKDIADFARKSQHKLIFKYLISIQPSKQCNQKKHPCVIF